MNSSYQSASEQFAFEWVLGLSPLVRSRLVDGEETNSHTTCLSTIATFSLCAPVLVPRSPSVALSTHSVAKLPLGYRYPNEHPPLGATSYGRGWGSFALGVFIAVGVEAPVRKR